MLSALLFHIEGEPDDNRITISTVCHTYTHSSSPTHTHRHPFTTSGKESIRTVVRRIHFLIKYGKLSTNRASARILSAQSENTNSGEGSSIKRGQKMGPKLPRKYTHTRGWEGRLMGAASADRSAAGRVMALSGHASRDWFDKGDYHVNTHKSGSQATSLTVGHTHTQVSPLDFGWWIVGLIFIF